ncbi:hypothetical protein T08_6037 [Trichinella sp. T8]|nr:hypothetical protein T08_6037 [Trichinella sp. T8]
MSGRSSSELRALLIAETPSSNWKIPCQAIMFGVSEKRLRGQMLDEMRSDTPPR